MNRSFLLLLLASTFAFAAQANEITFYIGRPQDVPPTSAFVPSDALPTGAWTVPGGVAAGAGTYELGIWAEVGCDASDPSAPVMDVWNGISVNLLCNADAAVIDFTMNNSDHCMGMCWELRWETTSDFGGGDGSCFLVSVTKHGLGGLWTSEWGMDVHSTDLLSYADGPVGESDTIYRYWLGDAVIQLEPGGAVWLQIGPGGISRWGGFTTDWIYFGQGETTGLHGNQFGAISSVPDFYEVPEPAGLLLLAFGGARLRRR